MELVSYDDGTKKVLAFAIKDLLYDCKQVHPQLPDTKEEMLADWKRHAPLAKLMYTALSKGDLKRQLDPLIASETIQVERVVEVE